MGKYLDIVKAFEVGRMEVRQAPRADALAQEGGWGGPSPKSSRERGYDQNDINDQSLPAAQPWPDRAADLVRWFQVRRAELPTEEFFLNPWMRISNPDL